MKPIIREYLASLREREELDAILPELLSALGYTVYSRPSRGTRQYGVDVAALSPVRNGEQRVCLFSVKRGDLTRAEWDGGAIQALRPSLNEIIDSYIPTRIPPEYKGLKITICLCFGGDISEHVRQEVTGYTNAHTTETLAFEEWNGDRMAGYLVDGVLSEDLAPAAARAHLRKAVALLDEPDAAYLHFRRLVDTLLRQPRPDLPAKILALRQLYLCSWVVFVWARDLGNLEAAYRIGELSLLASWELAKTDYADPSSRAEIEAVRDTFNGALQLYLTISEAYLDKFRPFVGLPDALSLAVHSQSPLDVNLKLFDLLGRFAIFGIWERWAERLATTVGDGEAEDRADAGGGVGGDATEIATGPIAVSSAARLTRDALALAAHNGALGLPLADHCATDVGLLLVGWMSSGLGPDEIEPWLDDAVGRLDYAVRTRSRYPSVARDYRELMAERRDRSDDAFKAATAASTFLPLLAVWTSAIGLDRLTTMLSLLVGDQLAHCNLQLWSPAADSEAHLYVNDTSHGRALSGLRLEPSGRRLIASLAEMVGQGAPYTALSAVTCGLEPLILVACRHWRLPVPVDVYIDAAAQAMAASPAQIDKAVEPDPRAAGR